jgi:signal transduction histidine kinase
VKNPLGAADGHLRLLIEGILGDLTEQQRGALQLASRSIGGAINLVDDLVDLARAETGHLELAQVGRCLRTVVEEAADEYRAQAEAKGLAMRIELPRTMPYVATDGRRVRQVLGNLISNAVKYTEEGSVTIRLRLAHVDAAGRCAAIEVEDTGPGIPAEQQHLLFREFVRLAPAAARGAGLGLTISMRLARALGGDITLDSEAGRGSTFTLLIPLRRSTDLRAA